MIPTYEQQLNLVNQGYAIKSENGNLVTFKYARKVMFDKLWDKIPGVRECRGHTYDKNTGELILLPFEKYFNYGENGTWNNIPLDTIVYMYQKYNGYMAAAAMRNDKLIVGTTGSTKSDFAIRAKELILENKLLHTLFVNSAFSSSSTILLEILDEKDQHIIGRTEDNTAKLLAVRNIYQSSQVRSPEFICTLQEALNEVKVGVCEGWVVEFTGSFGKQTCKLKTDYYVGKKALMRANKEKVRRMFEDTEEYSVTLPARWRRAPEVIIGAYGSPELWIETPEQDRRKFLEGYFG